MPRSPSDDDKPQTEDAKSPGSLTEKLAFKSRFVLVFGEIDDAVARSTCRAADRARRGVRRADPR